MSVTSLQDLGL